MKRPTWILLFILLVLVGLMVYLKRQDNLATLEISTPAQPVEFLIGETDGLPISIHISDNEEAKQFLLTRNEAGLWVMEKPTISEADQGSAEAAATQLSTLRILSRPGVSPADAGLTPESYLVSIDFSSGTHKDVRIGDLTPTSSGYYADIDGEPGIVILDQTGVQALLNLLESPPYLHTPTPTLAPSETPEVLMTPATDASLAATPTP